MDAWFFVFVTLAVPVAAATVLVRQGMDEKAWVFVAVPLWFGFAAMMGWGAGLIDDRPVPYADEITHHAHTLDEKGLVIVGIYFFGFGFLKTAIALCAGLAAGLAVPEKGDT